MIDQKKIHPVFISSFLITMLIFGIGMLANYGLDFFRIHEITSVMAEHELSTESYLAERMFLQVTGGNECTYATERLSLLKEELKKVGADLSTYSISSWFNKKNFDLLKRKYSLLQIRLYSIIVQLNKECDNSFIPILFFYQIDDTFSERQGFVLSEISENYPDKVFVLSFDKDYPDEPLLKVLTEKYNISTAPTIIIGDIKKEGIQYTGQVNATLLQILRKPDPYASAINFTLTLENAGFSVEKYTALLEEKFNAAQDPFAKGDLLLMLGRLGNNKTIICDSLAFFDAVNATAPQEQAVLYETTASLGCGRNKKAFYLEAAKIWDALNISYRAEIDRTLATGKTALDLPLNITSFRKNVSIPQGERIIIGSSRLVLTSKDIVLSQADRVNRDWLSLQINASPSSKQYLSVLSEQFTLPYTELYPEIGWHEGARLHELSQVGFNHIVGYGSLAKKFGNKWYSPDEKGIFRFEVPIDKVYYPTNRFLREDLALIMDTHGVNMLVSQAIYSNATVVAACCDHPGKIEAALYLAERNISTICFTDKYASDALQQSDFIMASAPYRFEKGKAILGDRPQTFSTSEPFVVANATSLPYAIWYYQTPTHYFSKLQSILPSLQYVTFTDFNQSKKLVITAQNKKSRVIATRIFNKNDYDTLKQWLISDQKNKAILFHSMAYPYGYKLFSEFPRQTTFGDVKVEVK